ncbi:MAG: tRNA (guanosine(37)-N1)-methyltransferase TrmD [Spirochaetes bacterium]|nr:tRNA (guanosine(37)-N1)-methyltransferase TrmD [Spirochaetota bacterium]
MKIKILTLFPQIIETYFSTSIAAKAVEKGLITYEIINIRDFARDKHKTCDDAPYGGGAGMVLKPEPLGAALEASGAEQYRTIFPTPSGRLFHQSYATELAQEKTLIFICGRYEGIDQRIIDLYVDDEISIGDYILSSGEVASLVLIDSILRLVPGVIKAESLVDESITSGLLEYPQYTRPEVYKGLRVPEILLSGNHAMIQKWRYEQSLLKTKKYRPDLLRKGN